jgi:hypothetical protein
MLSVISPHASNVASFWRWSSRVKSQCQSQLGCGGRNSASFRVRTNAASRVLLFLRRFWTPAFRQANTKLLNSQYPETQGETADALVSQAGQALSGRQHGPLDTSRLQRFRIGNELR